MTYWVVPPTAPAVVGREYARLRRTRRRSGAGIAVGLIVALSSELAAVLTDVREVRVALYFVGLLVVMVALWRLSDQSSKFIDGLVDAAQNGDEQALPLPRVGRDPQRMALLFEAYERSGDGPGAAAGRDAQWWLAYHDLQWPRSAWHGNVGR